MKTKLPPLSSDMTALLPPHGPHWAIEETAARQYLQMLRTTTVAVHMQDVEARSRMNGDEDEKEFRFERGIAFLDLTGPMTKAYTSYGSGTSTSYLRRMVRLAGRDPEVKGIVLRIDSPGGSVSGTADLADEVARIAAKKPVYAYIEDAGCSAAYWVASQCTKVFANPTALVGSIGTYMVLYDMSKSAEQQGIEVLVFSTGPQKGAGTPGTVITEEQRADFQRVVNDLNSHFLSAVSKGRSMKVAAGEGIATGAVWLAKEALSLGLIDEVGSLDDVVADMEGAKLRTKAEGGHVPTSEETISGEGGPLAGLTLAEESAAALAAVRGLTSRIADLKASREADGRGLSDKARGHLSDMIAALDEARDQASCLAQERPTDEGERKRMAELAARGRLALLKNP